MDRLKRINLISGKGGVGRSTLSAVLAKSASLAGKKTLLAELEDDQGSDSALAKIFGLPHLADEPKLIGKNLYGMRLSASLGQELFLNSFLRIHALSHSILSNKGVQWFLEGAPAFKEMGYFYHLLLQLRKKEFECIVIDLPATGHLVGLVRLPRILLRLIPIGPIADRLREGQAHFYDPLQTAAWIVTLPQTLPVSEAIELKDALIAETVPMGGFILNRAPFSPFSKDEEVEIESLFLDESIPNEFSHSLERIRRFKEAKEILQVETSGTNQNISIFIAEEVVNPLVDLTTKYPLKAYTC